MNTQKIAPVAVIILTLLLSSMNINAQTSEKEEADAAKSKNWLSQFSAGEVRLLERYGKMFEEALEETDIAVMKRKIDNAYRRGYNEIWAYVGITSNNKMQLANIIQNMQNIALTQMYAQFDKKTIKQFNKAEKKANRSKK